MQVFFSQGHAADVFEAYTQLLTEMVLRLPYQIKKIADTNSRIPPPVFDHSWFYFLSEVSESPKLRACWAEDTSAFASVGPFLPRPHLVFPLAVAGLGLALLEHTVGRTMGDVYQTSHTLPSDSVC